MHLFIKSRCCVGTLRGSSGLRILKKKTDEAHHTCKQTWRTFRCVLLRMSEKHPAAVSVTITRSQSHSTPSSLHTSKTAYYDILRVSPNATQAQIKTAYYRQSFRYHPDRNAGSDEAVRRFSEISEAYRVLGSLSLRRKYDRGVLHLSDVQSAGRPSRKDTAQAPSSDRQRSNRSVRGPGSKPMYDFDAFYRAHYGEQLDRERSLRRLRERTQEIHQKEFRTWKLEKGVEMAVGGLLALGVVLLLSLK